MAGCRSADERSKDVTTTASSNFEAESGRGIVISQIYGGGGASAALYNRDFVELFNPTARPISLRGLAFHYSGSVGTFIRTGKLPDDAVVPPGGYYLVGFAAGEAGADLRVDAAAGAPNLLPVNGKIALARDLDPADAPDAAAQELGCGATDARCSSPRIVDFVGYGAATDFEGERAAPAPGERIALHRKGGGCVDSRDSGADFEVAPPSPRSSRSPVHRCDEGGAR
jgi:hypothetical protein